MQYIPYGSMSTCANRDMCNCTHQGGDVMAKNEKVEIIFKKMLEKSRASRLASCGQK